MFVIYVERERERVYSCMILFKVELFYDLCFSEKKLCYGISLLVCKYYANYLTQSLFTI